MRKKISLFRIVLMLVLMLSAQSALAASKTYVYYGKRLDSFNTKIYNAAEKSAAKGLGSTNKITYTDPRTGISSLMTEYIVNDHPEFYWIGGYEREQGYSTDGYNYEFYVIYRPFAAWKNAAKTRSSFNKKVNSVVSTLNKKCKGKSTAQKSKIILEYLAKNCSYAESTYDQTAYGVFMKKKAVCAGYARAYKLLCDRLGVACICVEGLVDGTGHMVNFVKLGGKWYYVDPTWCDSGNKANYTYFLLGKKSSGCRVTQSCGIRVPSLTAQDYRLSKLS